METRSCSNDLGFLRGSSNRVHSTSLIQTVHRAGTEQQRWKGIGLCHLVRAFLAEGSSNSTSPRHGRLVCDKYVDYGCG